MIKAVIDIGTNSIKYLLADVCCGDISAVHKDWVKITRLGEGLGKTGRISPQALLRSAETAEGFVLDAKTSGAAEIRIVGTMALRTALNAEDFLRRIRERTGIEAEVLSGEDEAVLSFLGALSGFDQWKVKNCCMIDTGGGSTELVFAREGEIVCRSSLKIGALTLTEKYFSKDVVSREDLVNADNELKALFAEARAPFRAKTAVAIGGNATAMASVFKRMEKYDPTEAHGTILSEEEIDRQIGEYSAASRGERRKMTGLDPERADIILAGACIIRYAMKSCGCSEAVVSDRGLRHGVLLNM